jgi:creatinine amidohydrolase/Fe(II)-dependent formamide hydrolase-like protein
MPSSASAERGAELFDHLVEALAELLKRARAERDPEL